MSTYHEWLLADTNDEPIVTEQPSQAQIDAMYENRILHKWENTDAPNTLIMSEEPEHGSVMKPLRWYLRTPGTVERMAYIWVYEYVGGPTHLYDQTIWCKHENEYQHELAKKLADCNRFARNVAKIEVRERDAETGALLREA